MAEDVSCSEVKMNAEICKKTTLLHINASKGLTDIVNSLLETGADIKGKDENKKTPLHCSVDNGDKDVVEILLNAGANVNAQDDKQKSPLHVAVYMGHAEIVETLLKAGANVNSKDYYEQTPLYVAADMGYTQIVETLLKAQANANTADNRNMTPLHVAVQHGPAEIVETLLKAQANADAADNIQMTPLHRAVFRSAKIVDTLLKAGASVDAASYIKNTPLHYAARYGHAETVEALLKAGANVNAAGNTNMTPLHSAARGGDAEIVKTLLKAGANVNAKCYLGHTPLFFSKLYYHHEVTECLLKFEAGEGVWKRFVRHVSSALTIKTVSHTQSTRIVHVLKKSMKGVSSHSKYSHTSIMTCEPRDGHTDVTPSTAFANDIQHSSSSADCVTLPSSDMTANYCAVISDHIQATTSALPLGFSLQECEDIRKQVEDHWAKFSLQHKSHKGQCSTDVASVLKNGNIIIYNCPVNIKFKVVQNYPQESTQVTHAEHVTVNNRAYFSGTEPADSDADTDDSDNNDYGLEDDNEVST